MSDYPPNMTLRPIQAWPGPETPPHRRTRSMFSAPWQSTLRLLDRELLRLGDRRRYPLSVLQIALREQDFRIDGMPRATARPAHPGVILSIESSKGPLAFPADRFDRWQDNLRAIALALEALRQIDRYGITTHGEQYTGWRAIESGTAPTSAEYAEQAIRDLAGDHRGPLRSAARAARAAAHPDRTGDRAQYDAVDRYIQVLEREGRLS